MKAWVQRGFRGSWPLPPRLGEKPAATARCGEIQACLASVKCDTSRRGQASACRTLEHALLQGETGLVAPSPGVSLGSSWHPRAETQLPAALTPFIQKAEATGQLRAACERVSGWDGASSAWLA